MKQSKQRHKREQELTRRSSSFASPQRPQLSTRRAPVFTRTDTEMRYLQAAQLFTASAIDKLT